MIEAEWLECTDPQKMLEFLRGKASDRKLRLFAVACCRNIWELMGNDEQEVIEIVESYAEGSCCEEKIATAQGKMQRSTLAAAFTTAGWLSLSATAVKHLLDSRLYEGFQLVIRNSAQAKACFASVSEVIAGDVPAWKRKFQTVEAEERQKQYQFLRCIFGNPFRPIAINPAWLTWNDGMVKKIAQSIYDERGFDRMPVLADALQEAGCNDSHILAHCRQPGEHMRGCWVVDLCLGKE